MSFTVGIVGGGIAGSTIAIMLAQQGIRSVLFESSRQLINGPPFCHLHAGALYRDIPIAQCISLLKDSIDTLKTYRYSANRRPTLLTIPLRDPESPEDIIQRLEKVTKQYQLLVQENTENAVFGDPKEYFKIFTKEEVQRLRKYELPSLPKTFQDWLIPVSKHLDLQQFKFPIVMVQQYGLSCIRTSAYANIVMEQSRNSEVFLNTTVTHIKQTEDKQWVVTYKKGQQVSERKVQFLVNACGYRTGYIDDMAGFKRQRMVQFKASYITQWKQCEGHWPEVIIHGRRNTPFGMVQLTPYAKNFFQLHVMSEGVTLFQSGLVKSSNYSSQPKLNEGLSKILEEGWEEEQVIQRTKNAIMNVSSFINSFSTAKFTIKPLYGAQQIPGIDPNLRAAQISYEGQNYARSEIVKASTAIKVAEDLMNKLKQWFKNKEIVTRPRESFNNILEEQVMLRAKRIAKQRNYPEEIVDYYQ